VRVSHHRNSAGYVGPRSILHQLLRASGLANFSPLLRFPHGFFSHRLSYGREAGSANLRGERPALAGESPGGVLALLPELDPPLLGTESPGLGRDWPRLVALRGRAVLPRLAAPTLPFGPETQLDGAGRRSRGDDGGALRLRFEGLGTRNL